MLILIMMFALVFTGLVLKYVYPSYLARCRTALIITSACVLSLALGFYLNPDILKAWHFKQEQKALHKAKSILADKQQLAHLIQVLENRILLQADDMKAHVLLARIYAGQNNWEKAWNLIAKAYPKSQHELKISLFYVEARWHQLRHLDKEGRDILLELLAQNPNQIDSLMMLATDAKSRMCYHEALPYLQRLGILLGSDEKFKADLDQAIVEAQQSNDLGCKPAL